MELRYWSYTTGIYLFYDWIGPATFFELKGTKYLNPLQIIILKIPNQMYLSYVHKILLKN